MMIQRWHGAGLLAVAGFGLWLLLGSGRVFGADVGGLGVALLIGVTAVSMRAVSRMPTGEFERAVSPGEWKAWIGLAFMLVATAYLATNLKLMDGSSMAAASAVARKLVLLLVAWIVLSKLMASRWKDQVQEDERDRQIEVRAAAWSRGTLVVGVVALAVLLGFSPPDRLQWASHFMIGNLLVFALVCSWLVECGATAAMYWRDRH